MSVAEALESIYNHMKKEFLNREYIREQIYKLEKELREFYAWG